EMRSPVHLYIGQEAVATGVCAHLTPRDYVFGSHRSHGCYLAQGASLKGMFAELYGKRAGCAGGRGGSMHMIDESVGFMGTSSIVGGTIPMAVGAAWSAVLRGTDAVAAGFFGDAAVEEGAFTESLNLAALHRRFDTEYSAERRQRLAAFFAEWDHRLRAMPFDQVVPEGRVDLILLGNQIRYQQSLLVREERQWNEMQPLAPFADRFLGLQEARRRLERVDPQDAARALDSVVRMLDATRKILEAPDAKPPSKVVALRTAEMLTDLRRTMDRWYQFSAGYDPVFSWWVADPWRKTDKGLQDYIKFLREKLVGFKEGADDPIIGDPIGADGLKDDLAHEMIPYTPAELLTIAEREFAWTEAERLRASRDMGFGDDWRAAMERVKTLYVSPGDQPQMIRELAEEAIQFVETRDLVTVPPLAREIWRMEMMSAAAQKVSPFFLGGEVIQVSY
ncbi:MAG: DUF885 family protein, partial [Gemmatimonadota bacterium]